MIRLIYSNKLEILSARLANELRSNPGNVFARETIVTQTDGMGRWITLELARELGIAAGLEFISPAAFLQQMISLRDGSETATPSKITLAWTLFAILHGGLLTDSRFSELRNYAGDDQVRLLQLCARIGDLFDQYSLYRPAMVLSWDAGRMVSSDGKTALEPDCHWQYHLWREIFPEQASITHRARLLSRFTNSADARPLPYRRVSFFGVSYLPEYLFGALTHIGEYCDITLYIETPSRSDWWNTIDERRMMRMAIQGTDTAGEHFMTGNQLLSAFGSPGGDFRAIIMESGNFIEEELFDENPAGTMLGTVQNAILAGGEEDTAHRFESGDRSLTVHSCYGRMREIEVLHDHILDAVESLGLAPHEIAVLSPDIDTLAPYVEAVFGSAGVIPYSIADRSTKSTSELVRALRILLGIGRGGFRSSDFTELVSLSCVQRRLGINRDAAATITRWISDAGALWSADAAARERETGLSYDKFSWHYAIERMIAGYACGETSALFDGVAPMSGIAPHDADSFNALLSLLATVRTFADELIGTRTAAEWLTCIQSGMDAVMTPDEDESAYYSSVMGTLSMLTEGIAAAGLAGLAIPGELFVYEFNRQLDFDLSKRGFIDGRVTFAAMLPLRSIPFRMIALVGMDMDAFPRTQHSFAFDLIATSPRRGDRNLRNDDRYLFLETLLSARDRLHISYTGRDIRTNTEYPPSPVVTELLEYLDAHFITTEGNPVSEMIVRQHRLKHYADIYHSGKDTRFFTYAVSAKHSEPAQPFAAGITLEAPDQIELQSLRDFIADPAAHFLRHAGGIIIPAIREQSDFTEPLAFGSSGELTHSTHQAYRAIIDAILRGDDPDQTIRYLEATPVFPFGGLGTTLARSILRSADPRFQEEAERYRQGTPRSWSGVVQTGACSISALIDYTETAAGNERFIFAPSGSAVALGRAWIDHLALNAAGVSTRTLLVPFRRFKNDRYNRGRCMLPALDRDSAAAQLGEFVSYYRSFQQTPFPAFPDADIAAARNLVSKTPDEAAAIIAKELLPSGFGSPVKRLWQREPSRILFSFTPEDAESLAAYVELFVSRHYPLWRECSLAARDY